MSSVLKFKNWRGIGLSRFVMQFLYMRLTFHCHNSTFLDLHTAHNLFLPYFFPMDYCPIITGSSLI